MTRSTFRTILIILALVAAALALRWAGSGHLMDTLASLHGRARH